MLDRDDVIKLLQFAGIHDQRTIGQADIHAWHRILETFDYGDCQDAISRYYATERQQRIDPGTIATSIRNAHNERAMRNNWPRVRDGMPPHDPDLNRRGSTLVRQALAQALGHRGQAQTETTNWPDRPCPWCHAAPRTACTVPATGRPLTRPHPSRQETSCDTTTP